MQKLHNFGKKFFSGNTVNALLSSEASKWKCVFRPPLVEPPKKRFASDGTIGLGKTGLQESIPNHKRWKPRLWHSTP